MNREDAAGVQEVGVRESEQIEVQNTYPGFVRRIREVGLLIQVELKHVKKQVVHAITHKIDNRIRGGKQCDKDL